MDKISTDDQAQFRYYRSSGYFRGTPEPYADLGEIVAGRKPGRQRADERTMAMNLGLALDDMAVAPEIYRRAKERGDWHVAGVVSPDSAVAIDTGRSPWARLRPVPVAAVRLTDQFWAPRLRLNREVTLPTQYRLLEETGRPDNFRRAAGQSQAPFQGFFFNYSDVYKWLEAVAWALAAAPEAAQPRWPYTRRFSHALQYLAARPCPLRCSSGAGYVVSTDLPPTSDRH